MGAVDDNLAHLKACQHGATKACLEDVSNPAQRIRDAAACAAKCSDSYHATMGLAWPIAAFMYLGERKQAEMMAERAISKLPGVEPAPSRAEAALILFQAAAGLGHCRNAMVKVLIDLLNTSPGWRSRRALKECALQVTDGEHAAFLAQAGRLRDEKLESLVNDWIDLPRSEPRPFIF